MCALVRVVEIKGNIIMNYKILWLITARSGSKSITNKNIKVLAGYPLLAYRIKSALSFADSEDVWISTDSREYANIAESYGATVPFIRPLELSTDNASSVDVVLHAMQHAKQINKKYDAIGLLEPTSPLITYAQIRDAAKQLIEDNEAENSVAVRIIRPNTFFIQEQDKYLSVLAERLSNSVKWRRQDRKDEITPSGGFYIAKWEAFLENKTFYTLKTIPFLVSELNGLEIDETIDWDWAEFVLEKGLVKHKEIFL